MHKKDAGKEKNSGGKAVLRPPLDAFRMLLVSRKWTGSPHGRLWDHGHLGASEKSVMTTRHQETFIKHKYVAILTITLK